MELGLIRQVERSHRNTPVIRIPTTTEAGRNQSFVLARPPHYGGQSALLLVQLFKC